MDNKLNIVIIGCGNIGQALAFALDRSGHNVAFISRELRIKTLRHTIETFHLNRKSSRYFFTTGKTQQSSIKGFYLPDLIFVSVGYNNLNNISYQIKRLTDNKYLPPIVFFENHSNPGKITSNIGIPNLIAFKINPLSVKITYPFSFFVNNKQVVNLLNSHYFIYKKDINKYFFQKLYTFNTTHAAIAYLAATKSFTDFNQAINNKYIRHFGKEAFNEAIIGLKGQYNLSDKIVKQLSISVNNLFTLDFPDQISRICRNPSNKLNAKERLIYPALMSYNAGKFPFALCKAIAALLKYRNSKDQNSINLSNNIEINGVSKVLQFYSKIPPSHPIFKEIIKQYNNLG